MAKGVGSYIRKEDEKKIKKIDYCLYCGSFDDLMIDHIIPVSRGGNSDITNLTRCCKFCNSSKSNKTLDEFNIHIEEKRRLAWIEYDRCNRIIRSIRRGIYKIK